ncbi:MAG: hypothetical protein KatS3mg065_1141 [Chloroflexota bacterium]|nr:MAG: hypothetical protein KatS3mg065_1141 [Chloroflexota bacterium]
MRRESPPAEPARFVVGDRIHHPQKGMARVLALRDGIVIARFDDGETREIISTHPGMRLVEPLEEGRISPPWRESPNAWP